MCTQLSCNGYEAFKTCIAEHKAKKIFALFTGAADALDEESWCSDCVKGRSGACSVPCVPACTTIQN
jgi:hypothetical protein